MKKILFFLIAISIFVVGCSTECPYTPHPDLRPNSAPRSEEYVGIMNEWAIDRDIADVFDHSDLYVIPIQGPIYSDVDYLNVTVRSRVFGRSVVFWQQLLLEVERDGEWERVFYAPPRFMIDEGWALAGNPDGWNDYVSVDFHFVTSSRGRRTIYDRDVWSDGYMIPGNYRLVVFVGPHTFYFPFEIIARP